MKKISVILFTIILIAGFLASAIVKAGTDNTKIKKTTMTSNAVNETNTIDEPRIIFHTTEGDIIVKLYNDTPEHRDNMIKLVNEGYYNGLLFHRVIKDFMVQTGDPESRDAEPGKRLGGGDPNYTIKAEIEYPVHYHKYGALAAARTGDQFNPERRSSGSQFYIVTGQKFTESQLERMNQNSVMQKRQMRFRELSQDMADSIINMQKCGDTIGLDRLKNELVSRVEQEIVAEPLPADIIETYTTLGGTPHLDGQYTVFGEVISGMETVEKIQNVETDSSDRPREDIKIISAEIMK